MFQRNRLKYIVKLLKKKKKNHQNNLSTQRIK